MAKRRNLKKEKALRNQAYARKFRKRSNNRYGRRNMNTSKPDSDDNSTDKDEQAKDTSSAASD